jgi:prepilin-type N-terminal cleavage/methylation domain-containing protein
MKRRDAGFTLIELVVAITLMGICSATVLGFMSQTSERSARVLLDQQATGIAESYLREALSKSFLAIAGSRNDVSDYNFSETGAHDSRGSAIAGLGNFNIQVSAQYVALGTITLASKQCYEVIVTVTDGFGGSVSLVGYRTAH